MTQSEIDAEFNKFIVEVTKAVIQIAIAGSAYSRLMAPLAAEMENTPNIAKMVNQYSSINGDIADWLLQCPTHKINAMRDVK